MSDELPDQLKEAIRNLRRRSQAGVDLSPRSPFDALLEERLKALERQVEELKSRVHGLMFLIAERWWFRSWSASLDSKSPHKYSWLRSLTL